jgi:hypothetical protein
MKYLLIVLLFLLAPMVRAQAVRVELGAGYNLYHPVVDGTWYQRGEPHKLQLSSPSFYLGFTGTAYEGEHFGVNWHAGYLDLGQLSASCYCLIDDADYSSKGHRRIREPQYPNAHYSGSGKVRGVLVMVEPYVLWHGYRIGAELGVLPYRPRYDEIVTDWRGPGTNAPLSGAIHTSHALQRGTMVGLSIGRGAWSVAYEFYRLPMLSNRSVAPPLWTAAHQVMFRFAW